MIAVDDLKRTHRATWAAGDYAAVAERIDEVPPADLLATIGIRPGEEVLDVATGPATSPSRLRPRAGSYTGST